MSNEADHDPASDNPTPRRDPAWPRRWSRKAAPAEAEAYRKMLADAAEKAPAPSTEGGLLGIGGVRVSDE